MTACDQLNKLIFSFFVFVVFAAGEAKGVVFKVPSEFDDNQMMRCMTACCIARYVKPDDPRLKKEHEKYWVGEKWTDDVGERINKPVVEPLVFDQSLEEQFLGPKKGDDNNRLCGVLIGKGREIIIAFSGTALWKTKTWKEKNELFATSASGEGAAHWGSFQLWNAVKCDLLGGGTGLLKKESRIQKYIDAFNEQLTARDGKPLKLGDFQITVVGHSIGGMVAQWCARRLLRSFYNDDNGSNNVVVMTMGSPRVFNDSLAESWNRSMGGSEKHLRVVGKRDTFWNACSGKPFAGVTGAEMVLEQSERGLGTGVWSWMTDGEVNHYLRLYEGLFSQRFDHLTETEMAEMEELLVAAFGEVVGVQ